MQEKIKRVMHKIKRIIRILLTRFTPIIQSTVFFDSFRGQYNDNPKYISEKLHEIDPEINIIWSVSKHGKECPPQYAKTVITGSAAYYKYAFCSQVTVDNYTGLRTLGFMDNKWHWLIDRIVIKPGQLSISTWHGTPLKKIGADYVNYINKYYCTGMTYIIAGCEYTKKVLERAFRFDNRVKTYGTPRNDILFRKINSTELKEKLSLPIDHKIVLYAPTFRDSIEMSGLNQIKLMDVKKLLCALNRKFGGEFVFAFRAHHRVMDQIKVQEHVDDSCGIINGNLKDDMAEYLACIDVLITDYSGSMFDFTITGKPCFLFSPDREEYTQNERGVYIDYSSLPFPQSDNFDGLIHNIDTFSAEEYIKRVELFQKRIGNVEDGYAAERVVRDIIEHVKGVKT